MSDRMLGILDKLQEAPLRPIPSGTQAELAESRKPLNRLRERASQLAAWGRWVSERKSWYTDRGMAGWVRINNAKLVSDWERFSVGLDLYMTKEGGCPESERLQVLAMRELERLHD